MLGVLRDFLLRDCDITYFRPAILQCFNEGIGYDGYDGKRTKQIVCCRFAKSGGVWCYTFCMHSHLASVSVFQVEVFLPAGSFDQSRSGPGMAVKQRSGLCMAIRSAIVLVAFDLRNALSLSLSPFSVVSPRSENSMDVSSVVEIPFSSSHKRLAANCGCHCYCCCSP